MYIVMEGRGERENVYSKKVCIKGVYLQADKPRNCSYIKERRAAVVKYMYIKVIIVARTFEAVHNIESGSVMS